MSKPKHHCRRSLSPTCCPLPQSSSISSSLQSYTKPPMILANQIYGKSETMTSPPSSSQYPIKIERPIIRIDDIYYQTTTTTTEATNNYGTIRQPYHTLNINQSMSKYGSSIIHSSQSSMLTTIPSERYGNRFHCCNMERFIKTIIPFIPIIGWVRNYQIQSDLLADIVTGFTILALHIPQGLAYGQLAGVDSINGLYVSTFPVIIYAIFGGSRQISVGTFAVICIACKDVLIAMDQQGLLLDGLKFNRTGTIGIGNDAIPPATSIEVLTSLCLLVGIIQFTIGILRLGCLGALLSDPIISSFVAACSIHVFTSQIFGLFGISSKIDPSNEPNIPFDLIKDWIRFIERIPSSNLITIYISIGTIITLYCSKYYFEPWLMKRLGLRTFAFPIDIIAIIILTVVSYWANLPGNFSVTVIPKIEGGFAGLPVVPRIDLWSSLFTSAVLISFIGYAATYTLSTLYARKHGYEIESNQELIALGLANMGSSFFLCFPSSGSLARSTVQERIGGRTQLASLISSSMIVVFITYMSHFFEYLPKCVLSCIIVVALISTMLQCSEVVHYYRQSKMDALVWIGTFVNVILFGVGNGLLYGLVIQIIVLIIQIALPQFSLKINIPNSECYIPQSANHLFIDQYEIIVCEHVGPLIFLNVERFKRSFHEQIIVPIERRIETIRLQQSTYQQHEMETTSSMKRTETLTIIIDMSRITFMDEKATQCLIDLKNELKSFNQSICINLRLAAMDIRLLDRMKRAKFFDRFNMNQCYLTVHDAVIDRWIEIENNCTNNNR
ncbi:hypothetical protein RDWZM_010365 [Blomia tropicalis]|uniref:STAS domain-containing protein n=1 Tax=Blomia tropicalis TaxID=40697 RepID=A0A9Q0LYC3_BLOTA|nr:hypothetical protein RDWZM_010365 [Blomia tropicalis]